MRVSAESLVVIIVVLLTAAAAVMGAAWMARRKRDEHLREHGSPLLVMPVTAASETMRDSSLDVGAARRTSPIRVAALDASIEGVPFAERGSKVAGAVADPLTATTGKFIAGSPPAEVVHGHSLRFHRPAEGTLEFLPGCLEVVGGPDAGHEIRFVRPEDGVKAQITFGRREGPPYVHIQLLEPTVSRSHARLTADGDRWRLANLSRTNPVLVNRIPLDGVETSQLLNHDDLIEMGALVFRFRAR